jgi:hypothetical protein
VAIDREDFFQPCSKKWCRSYRGPKKMACAPPKMFDVKKKVCEGEDESKTPAGLNFALPLKLLDLVSTNLQIKECFRPLFLLIIGALRNDQRRPALGFVFCL